MLSISQVPDHWEYLLTTNHWVMMHVLVALNFLIEIFLTDYFDAFLKALMLVNGTLT